MEQDTAEIAEGETHSQDAQEQSVEDALQLVPPARADRELMALVADLAARLTAVDERTAEFHERSRARERVADRLLEENDRLRTGERNGVLRPVAVDLQRLRNDLLRQAASLPSDMDTPKMAALLESFAFSTEQALERCGIQVVRPRVGDRFDPARHRAEEIERAAAPEDDSTISAVLADGYLDSVVDRAIAPASVRVQRWIPEQPEEHA